MSFIPDNPLTKRTQYRAVSVLITRPLDAALQLAGQLGQYGIHSIVMPLYTFAPHQPGLDVREALTGPEGRGLAVFTSPRAVQFGLEHIPPDILQKLELAAVGAATSAQLAVAGHQVDVQPRCGYTSEDLLQVPALAVDPGIAVIFCAPGGRTRLARGLRDLGWTVSLAMVYQRQPEPPAAELIGEIDAAEGLLSVWTSVSAFELAREYLPATAWRKILQAPALVISARIKHHLQQAGVAQVVVAEGPGNAGLLKSIQVELSKRG